MATLPRSHVQYELISSKYQCKVCTIVTIISDKSPFTIHHNCIQLNSNGNVETTLAMPAA
jgi:hypothetical protein